MTILPPASDNNLSSEDIAAPSVQLGAPARTADPSAIAVDNPQHFRHARGEITHNVFVVDDETTSDMIASDIAEIAPHHDPILDAELDGLVQPSGVGFGARLYQPVHCKAERQQQGPVRPQESSAHQATTGRSAKRIARHFIATMPDGGDAYSATLTERTGTIGELRYRVRLYLKAIRAELGALAILGIDRGNKNGHYHLHGLVVVPPTAPGAMGQRDQVLRDAWLNLWPERRGAQRTRPYASAQCVNPVLSRQAQVLTKVLTHALDRHAEREARAAGIEVVRLPVMADRVFVSPEWRDRFNRACEGRRTPKPTTPRERRRLLAVPGHRCGWCCKTEPMRGRRKDARWCSPSCSAAASRALTTFVADTRPKVAHWLESLRRRASMYGVVERPDWDLVPFLRHDLNDWHIGEWLRRLESKPHYWTRRDALRVIRAAIDTYAWPTTSPRHNRRLAAALVCECGAKLPKHGRAKTCGDSACQKVWRHFAAFDAQPYAAADATAQCADVAGDSPTVAPEAPAAITVEAPAPVMLDTLTQVSNAVCAQIAQPPTPPPIVDDLRNCASFHDVMRIAATYGDIRRSISHIVATLDACRDQVPAVAKLQPDKLRDRVARWLLINLDEGTPSLFPGVGTYSLETAESEAAESPAVNTDHEHPNLPDDENASGTRQKRKISACS